MFFDSKPIGISLFHKIVELRKFMQELTTYYIPQNYLVITMIQSLHPCISAGETKELGDTRAQETEGIGQRKGEGQTEGN